MSSWAERQRKQADMMRGQGKHEELLLQCKLREYRHPFSNSLEMKYMDKEKQKIQNELTKIRHTIHHERRNSRAKALSTRHLTMEAIAPRRSQSAIKTDRSAPLNVATERSPRVVVASRMSLDPLLLAAAEKSYNRENSKLASKELRIQQDSGLLSSVIPEINENSEEKTDIPPVIIDQPPEGATADSTVDKPNDINTATTLAINLDQPTAEVEPTSDENQNGGEPLVMGSIYRMCRRQPTFMKERQFTFINRSNTYIKRRKEMRNSSDILSCIDYNSMRKEIANETLKKLGLLYRP